MYKKKRKIYLIVNEKEHSSISTSVQLQQRKIKIMIFYANFVS